MKAPTQKQLNKMPEVSLETLSNTRDSIRNYYVYLGEKFPTMMIPVHCGMGSGNHLETIRALVKAPVYKVLMDNRKMK